MKQKGLSQERESIVMTEKENTAGNGRIISSMFSEEMYDGN